MFFRVGGSRCTASAADESPDVDATQHCFRFLIFCSVFKSQRSECVWGRLHFLTPAKNRGGLVESSVGNIRATPRF